MLGNEYLVMVSKPEKKRRLHIIMCSKKKNTYYNLFKGTVIFFNQIKSKFSYLSLFWIILGYLFGEYQENMRNTFKVTKK